MNGEFFSYFNSHENTWDFSDHTHNNYFSDIKFLCLLPTQTRKRVKVSEVRNVDWRLAL
jgi:hypothetical protein